MSASKIVWKLACIGFGGFMAYIATYETPGIDLFGYVVLYTMAALLVLVGVFTELDV